MTLHVSNKAEIRLKTLAEREGLDPAAFVEKLIAEYQPGSSVDSTLALFAKWSEEDADMSDEERAENDRIYAEIEKNGIPRLQLTRPDR